MKNLSIWGIFILTCAVCLWQVGGSLFSGLEERNLFQSVVTERLEYAASGSGDIFVGAAGHWSADREMLEGIEFAAEAVNKNGGLLGRKLVIKPGDDQGSFDGALRVAQGFCNDSRMGFVIGHADLALSATAVQNYEFYNLLVMSPAGSNPNRSGQGFQLSLGNGLSPEQFADGAVDFVVDRGWKNVGLLYSDAEYGSRLARRFESAGDSHDVLCMTGVLPPLTSEGREELREWLRGLAIEVVVLSASPKEERWLADVCRETGNVPVILAGIAGGGAAGMAPTSSRSVPAPGGVFTLQRLGLKESATNVFAKAFQECYGRMPGERVLAGYDALMLVAQAAEQAKSLVPTDISQALRSMEKPRSVTGTVGFDDNGNAVKETLKFISVRSDGL